jgi:hypothetical protein
MALSPTSRGAGLPSNAAATKPATPAHDGERRTASSGESRQIDVLHNANGLVIATWKNVAIHVWTAEATRALVDTLDQHSAPFTRAHPERVSSIHIIGKNAPLPSADVREQLQQLTKRYASHIAALCHVVEGSGFWASALHGFLTGLHWLIRGSFQLKTCADIESAARWVPSHHLRETHVAIGINELEEVLRHVRRLAD